MQKPDTKAPSWARGSAALTLAVGLLAAATTPLLAQDSARQAVTVNLDVLYNLDESPLPGPFSAPPAPLLPAPSQAPRSRLLVAPAPVAVAAPTPEVSQPILATPAPAVEPAPTIEPALPVEPPVEPLAQVAQPAPSVPAPPAPPAAPEIATQPTPEATAPAAPPVDPVPAPAPAPTPAPDNGVAQAPALETSPPAPQTAALTPGPVPTLEQPIRLLFEPQSASLSDTAGQELSDLAARLLGAQGQRIQLLAYADASDGGNSLARRLSLSRALSVRGRLVAEGVPSSQIDVRALGGKFDDGPADRVDIIYVSR